LQLQEESQKKNNRQKKSEKNLSERTSVRQKQSEDSGTRSATEETISNPKENMCDRSKLIHLVQQRQN
jgi:hypothetical protein